MDDEFHAKFKKIEYLFHCFTIQSMMAFILQVSMHTVLSLSSDFLYNLALKLGFFTCFLQLLNNIRELTLHC